MRSVKCRVMTEWWSCWETGCNILRTLAKIPIKFRLGVYLTWDWQRRRSEEKTLEHWAPRPQCALLSESHVTTDLDTNRPKYIVGALPSLPLYNIHFKYFNHLPCSCLDRPKLLSPLPKPATPSKSAWCWPSWRHATLTLSHSNQAWVLVLAWESLVVVLHWWTSLTNENVLDRYLGAESLIILWTRQSWINTTLFFPQIAKL